ncbi:hypothetical protein nvc1_038 [Namao virus]|nr:hypothetical protein nvc1_038 [Namao virus]
MVVDTYTSVFIPFIADAFKQTFMALGVFFLHMFLTGATKTYHDLGIDLLGISAGLITFYILYSIIRSMTPSVTTTPPASKTN